MDKQNNCLESVFADRPREEVGGACVKLMFAMLSASRKVKTAARVHCGLCPETGRLVLSSPTHLKRHFSSHKLLSD